MSTIRRQLSMYVPMHPATAIDDVRKRVDVIQKSFAPCANTFWVLETSKTRSRLDHALCLPETVRLVFPTVHIIEQEDTKPWQVLAVYVLTA